MLDFSNNKFGGSLSNSIGNLSMLLNQLYFDGNQISGIIPSKLENLINLTTLNMAQNLFNAWHNSLLFWEVSNDAGIGFGWK
jgi:Leucine-rich repeat (LRR) protein